MASPDSLNARNFKKNVKEPAKWSQQKTKAIRRELQIEFFLESGVDFQCWMKPQELLNPIWATAHFHMPTPKILTDVADIPDNLKITHGEEELLYYDSESHGPETLFNFATPSNLGILENYGRYCDGTFSQSPDNFYRVYTYNS